MASTANTANGQKTEKMVDPLDQIADRGEVPIGATPDQDAGRHRGWPHPVPARRAEHPRPRGRPRSGRRGRDGPRRSRDVQELTPDIVLMDLALPSPNGIETTQRLKRELPHTGVIVLASNDDEDQLFDAIKAGAAAYVLKDIDPTDLIAIIRRVRSGEYLITTRCSPSRPSRRGAQGVPRARRLRHDAAPIFAPLSPREVEILDNIAQGMTNKQVAYALSISEQTVKNHMSSILRKLSVNDRTQAVVYAMRQGWIKIPED